MEWQSAQLWNVATLDDIEPGWVRPSRYPNWVRTQLGEKGSAKALKPSNVELRFVCESPGDVRLTLRSEGETRATVFFGPLMHRVPFVIGAEPTTIEFSPTQRLQEVRTDQLPFSTRVCRIMFHGDAIHLGRLDGPDHRPPRDEELPERCVLMYGTSITSGALSSRPHLTYASIAARRLGLDLLNLGLGGACRCESAVAEWIASREDWQLAVLGLSVNMLGDFSANEFRERIDALIQQVAGRDPSRPVVCVTLFPSFHDLEPWQSRRATRSTPQALRAQLRAAVADCNLDNVSLVEGPDLLHGYSGLTDDLLHPSDDGMHEIGANLAARLRAVIDQSPSRVPPVNEYV